MNESDIHSSPEIEAAELRNTRQSGIFAGCSRRAFLAAAAALAASGCRVARPFQTADAAGAVKTTPNSGYRTPSAGGPVPRNPDMRLSSNFARNAGITFTRVPVSGNYVAITFDDGPHPQNTPRLLDILRARNVKATFYVIGRSVDLHPGVVRRTVAEGHEIGNHSHTHRLMTQLSDSEVRNEMQRCEDAIGRAAGVRPRTMRPPYGGLNQRQRELVHAEFGYPTILWNVDPLDWKRPGPSVVAQRMISGASPGGILLAHDLHSQTVDAMPATLDGLLRRGYKFVTVSQLIAMGASDATAQVVR
ncbi:MAG: polysaccharide deacetylase family protein [Luteolibacter sp.]|jgi:peptidoglycan-N-acetylglucosamine deacetylase